MLCHLCNTGISPQTSKKNSGMCESCHRDYISQSDTFDEWELSPENAHPVAREKLTQEFFWDICDENSPLGNDTGADVLSFFREWREENKHIPVSEFLHQVLLDWDVQNSKWDLFEDEKLRIELEHNEYDVNMRDAIVIGLAFSQIVLEGKVEEDIKQKALLAVQRQMKDIVIKFNGWVNPEERKQRLVEIQKILEEIYS